MGTNKRGLMKKTRCNLCKARTFNQLFYRGVEMCIQCAFEYAQMIDGRISLKQKKKREKGYLHTAKKVDRIGKNLMQLPPNNNEEKYQPILLPKPSKKSPDNEEKK